MKTIVLMIIVLVGFINAQDTLSKEIKKEIALAQTPIADEQKNSNCSIMGSVIDQFSREPIENAKVTALGTKFSSTTSTDGQYTISVSIEGIYQLRATASGYEPQILNNVYFKEGKNSGGFFTLQKTNQEPADFVPVEKQPQPIPGKNLAPLYPEEAKKQNLEGTVWVKIWVDKNGNAHKAVILKSDAEIFNKASIDAAMKWKFSPAFLKGEPVDVWVAIPFKFKLSKDGAKP